jgi:hypothetical protein
MAKKILITAYLNEFNSQYRNNDEILALQKDYYLSALKNMIHLYFYKKTVVLYNNMPLSEIIGVL